MSQSVWGYWLISLGIGVITVMMLVQNYTTVNQEDYYLLKEVTQASMNDAIDYNHYRQYEELKINREKFIENFIRRFSESIKGNKNYKLDFYDIYETPPKVSVRVSTKTGSFNISGDVTDLDVTNSIDAILENNSTNTITKTFYSVPISSCMESKKDALGYCTITNTPKLNSAGIKKNIVKELETQGITVSEDDLKFISAKYLGPITTDEEFNKYRSQFYETYDYDGGHGGDPNKTIQEQIPNEIVDVKLTVAKGVLAWSGKFKCEDGQGYQAHELDSILSCLIGIKYEIKFEYPT